MVDVKHILPLRPVPPIKRRWHAPDERPPPPPQRELPPQADDAPDDGHIDEYA